MGVASILVNLIFKRLSRRLDDPKTGLVVTASPLSWSLRSAHCRIGPRPVINDFGFLSMGLRGAVFVPRPSPSSAKAPISEKVGALFRHRRPWPSCWAVCCPFDSLFLGMAVSLLCCAAGAHFGKDSVNRLSYFLHLFDI